MITKLKVSPFIFPKAPYQLQITDPLVVKKEPRIIATYVAVLRHSTVCSKM
jgi:hypothetical protein